MKKTVVSAGMVLCLLLPVLLSTQWLETTISVSGNPWALCWNTTSNKVYCAHENSDNVMVIDGVADSVIATVALGYGFRNLYWNATNNTISCANRDNDNVTVIDGATDMVITTIAVGNSPCAFACNDIQNITYVANHFSSTNCGDTESGEG